MVKRCVWVGHLAHDLIEGGGWRWGGGVYYGARACARLGMIGCVWTVLPDKATQSAQELPQELRWESLERGSALTTFENTYDEEGARVQRVRARGPSLVARRAQVSRGDEEDEGALWVLAPLLDELEVEPWVALARERGATFVALLAQGLCRQVAGDGLVSAREDHDWIDHLEGVELVVLSEEDLGADEEVLARLVAKTKRVAYTRGAAGARLYEDGALLGTVGVWPVDEVIDPTGAGDVFGAVLASRLAQGQPIWAAASEAAAAASLVVEAVGVGQWDGEECLRRGEQIAWVQVR